MKKRRVLSAMLLALFAAVCLMHGSLSVQAQTATPPVETTDPETNLDTTLFLIVGTNQDVVESRMPASLDPVLRQLRSALPFKNYRLAATLINRVKNEGRLDLSWIGGPMASAVGTAVGTMSAATPSFSQFKVRQVKLVRNSEGQQMVQMAGFHFGARIPIQSQTIAANGTVLPNFNYESTGLATDISLRESEAVIVGTLNLGPSGDAIILVVSAKRTQK